jgi:16S rRNA (adenine(1408)-N(1))-methyltransferase
VTIDVGTGDGRAVLAAAAREPATLVLGMDANAAGMAEASRRASRRPARGGLPNAGFVVAAAESLPAELAGLACRVTVAFPWGSLLRGCVGLDAAVSAGLAGLVAPGGQLELLLAPAERDGLEAVPTSVDGLGAAAARTFAPLGFGMVPARTATPQELRASGSTWARRLGSAAPPGAGHRGSATGAEGRVAALVRLQRLDPRQVGTSRR